LQDAIVILLFAVHCRTSATEQWKKFLEVTFYQQTISNWLPSSK